jgi:serine/threonine-protein kinase
MSDVPQSNADSQAKTRLSSPSESGSTEEAGEILDADGIPAPVDETILDVGQSIGHPSIYATVAVQPANGETIVELGPAPTTQVETNASTRIVSTPLTESARYELLNEIGRGGMGVVFKAHDKDLRRHVALKISRADRATGRSHGRFIEEAQVQGQLSHPNIVPVHELGIDPRGRPYFTMKLVEGRDPPRPQARQPDAGRLRRGAAHGLGAGAGAEKARGPPGRRRDR